MNDSSSAASPGAACNVHDAAARTATATNGGVAGHSLLTNNHNGKGGLHQKDSIVAKLHTGRTSQTCTARAATPAASSLATPAASPVHSKHPAIQGEASPPSTCLQPGPTQAPSQLHHELQHHDEVWNVVANSGFGGHLQGWALRVLVFVLYFEGLCLIGLSAANTRYTYLKFWFIGDIAAIFDQFICK